MLDLSRPRLVAVCTVFAGLAAGSVLLAMLAAPALAAGRSVSAKDGAFSPATITIKVGDTITWTNVGVLDHDVTFQGFRSGTLAPGETYKHTFAKAATFAYRCTIHGNTAKVVVAGPPTAQPTKKPTPKPTRTPAPKLTRTPALSPSPTPGPTPSASASRGPSASPDPTPTPTSVSSAASATPSAFPTPSSTDGQPTPVGATAGPTTAIVVALVVAAIAGVGAFVVRRR
jgi:plastocyanin